MRALFTYGFVMLTYLSCKAQEQIIGKYIGYQYTETQSVSFTNRQLLFLNGDSDTLKINIKIPFNVKMPRIINPGIYYNCHLKEDTVYILTLKKICANDIPEAFNSYYKTNTIPDKKDCTKFIEIEKNTAYKYTGNYGKYVDIDEVLYEVIGISPGDGCFYLH